MEAYGHDNDNVACSTTDTLLACIVKSMNQTHLLLSFVSGTGQQPPRHPSPADPRMNRPTEQQPPPVQHHQPPPPGRGGQFGGPPPPHNHPPGHYDSRGQAPPPGHMPQQGPTPPHWRGPGGPPPPAQGAGGPGYRDGPPGEEHFEHSRDPRDRRREERERHDRSPTHRRSSNDRDVPPSKRSRIEEKDDRSSKPRPNRPKRD